MERLTNHFDYCEFIECKWRDSELEKVDKCKFFDATSRNKCHEKSVYEKLRAYEDLEEQGILLRLPCRVGDPLYIVGTKCFADQEPEDYDCDSVECDECQYDKELIVFKLAASPHLLFDLMFKHDDNFILGKTVFLTREEAEKVLAKMG